jgi:predicted MFS family arabinose efflux permease
VTSPSPRRRALEGGHALSTIVVLVGVFGPAVNTFITATVLPSVVREIGGLPLYAWATTAYAVASIVGSAASSILMRGLGTRLALIVAALVLVGGTAACGAAPTMPVVVAGRAIQGVGGGLTFGIVHGMVRELFPEPMWPSRLALISTMWGVAAIGGPFAGGLLAQVGMWRTAFWGMVPIIVAPAIASWWLLPRRARRGPPPRAPLGRLLLICAAVLCLASVANVRATAIRAALALAALLAIALTLRLDARARARLFPSDMLSFGRPTGKGFAMIFLIAAAGSPTGVFISLLAQVTHGVTPATAGYFYAVQSLAWSIASLFSARVQPERLRLALVSGPLIMAAGLGGVALSIGPGPVLAIAVALAVVGVGIGVCWAHIAKIVLAAAREGEEEVSAALTPSAQLFAVAFGAAGAGIVASATGLSHTATPEVAALTGTVLFAVAALGPLVAAAMALTLSPPPPSVRGRPR